MMSFTTASSPVKTDKGGASECAVFAKGVIIKAADDYNLDISSGGSDYELMMYYYKKIYLDCYEN